MSQIPEPGVLTQNAKDKLKRLAETARSERTGVAAAALAQGLGSDTILALLAENEALQVERDELAIALQQQARQQVVEACECGEDAACALVARAEQAELWQDIAATYSDKLHEETVRAEKAEATAAGLREEAVAARWIPIEEELPEIRKESGHSYAVQVYKGDHVCIWPAYYIKTGFHELGTPHKIAGVTHWRHFATNLPAPAPTPVAPVAGAADGAELLAAAQRMSRKSQSGFGDSPVLSPYAMPENAAACRALAHHIGYATKSVAPAKAPAAPASTVPEQPAPSEVRRIGYADAALPVAGQLWQLKILPCQVVKIAATPNGNRVGFYEYSNPNGGLMPSEVLQDKPLATFLANYERAAGPLVGKQKGGVEGE